MKNGFIVENWKHKFLPTEDAFKYNEDSTAVSDGITRDPFLKLPDLKTLRGKLNWIIFYPRLSPAKLIADVFCDSFVWFMRQFKEKDEKAIYRAFEQTNEEIRRLNEIYNPNPDFLKNDFWACVAAGTALREQDKQKILSYGFITDCGVAVFDNKGNLRLKTPNEMIHAEDFIPDFNWRSPEQRADFRKRFRNNPSNPNSYGALTGEKVALNYVRTGELEIFPEDIAITYSDGLEGTIISGEFTDKLRQRDFAGLKKLCKKM